MRTWLLSLAAVVEVACGSVGVVPDSDSGGFSVAVAPASVFVRRLGTQTATVTVTRDATFSSDIAITVSGLPSGVTVDDLTIPNGSTTGTLTLHASPTATEGAVMVMVAGDGGGVMQSSPTRLLVGGAPGSLDESFGTAGKFVTALGTNALVGRGIAITTGGGIIATGVNLGMSQAVVLKLLPDGTLDPTFGAGGIVTTGAGAFAEGLAIATLANGNLIVAGVANGNGTTDDNFGVFGYTANGTLDTTFGMSGVASLDPSANTFAEFHSVAIAPDGSIIASGPVFPSGAGSLVSHEVRFSATGIRDATFDTPETGVVFDASVMQPDGKLVAAGSVSGDFVLARYNAAGGRDAGFGSGGLTITDLGTASGTIDGLALLAGGKLLAVGTDSTHVVIARYNANGSPDLTFGTNGKVTSAVAFSTRSPNAAVVDSTGKILYVGLTSTKPSVTRFAADGTVDPDFGTAGVSAIDFGVTGSDSQTGGYGVAVDSDDRIVFSGEVGPAGGQRLVVGRLWP